MTPLICCPECTRHLRRDEPMCPFCAAEIPEEARTPVVSSVPTGASRAKRYAARMAIIAGAAAVAACGGGNKKKEKPTPDPTNQPPPPTPYGCVWPDDCDERVKV